MMCLFVNIRVPEPLLNGHISGNLAAVRDINEAKLYYTSLWDSFGVERKTLGSIPTWCHRKPRPSCLVLINCHISGNLDAGRDIYMFIDFLSFLSKNKGGKTFSYAEECREPTKFKSLNLFQLCSKFVLYSFKLLPHPLKKNFPSSGLSRQTNDGHHSPSSPLLK